MRTSRGSQMLNSKVKKAVIGGLVIGIMAVSSVFALGFSDKDKAISYTLQEKATDNLPAEFKTKDNLDAKKLKLGIDDSNQRNTDLKINFKLEPIADDNYHLNVLGNGTVDVDQNKYNFTISETTRLNQTKLSNGNTFIWGPIDATIKDKSGEVNQMVLGIAFIPETNQKYFTCTIGTMDNGLAAMTFGQSFSDPELLKIVENWRN